MKRINGNNSNNSNNSSNNSNTEFWINMYTSNTSLSLELSSPDDQRGRMFEQQRPPNKRNKKIRKVNLDMGGSAIDVSEAFSAIKTHLSLSSFSLSSSHFSPLNNDQDAGEMSYEEKYKLVLGLMSLPAEKYFQASQIMRKRNIELKQLDLDALDKETLWELDRFVADYEGMASEPMRPALMGTGNDMFTVANNSNERNGNVLASASNTNEMPTGSTLDADEGLEKVHFSVPVVGMEFYSEEEACNFYKCYAQRIGFKVRKGKVQRLSSGDVKKRYFFCSREGFRLKKQSNKKTKYNRKETRTGCNAKMECTVKDGKWVISQFSEKHNHHLGDQIIVESQAGLSEAPLVICSNNGAEMEKDAGATKFVQSCSMDRIAHEQCKKAGSLQSEDAQNLINFLRRLQAEDPSFFHTVQLDADCRLKNIFWRDGRAKIDYGYFGDLVILDTSFKLDKYDIICAPFLGMNHHRQFILFGCAFLLDESTDSFIWLLETFMESMGGNQPKTIITDEGRAMSDAVKLKLPKAQHQIGLWYIRQNAAKHLSTYFEQPGFKRLFDKCISDCETEKEFKSTWSSLLEKFNLWGNEWLVNLHTSRNQWCHMFSRKIFSAGIQCNARIESIFQNLTGQDDAVSLSTFVKQYLRAAEQQRREELHEDLACHEIEPSMILAFCPAGVAEKQVADAYTYTMFEVFQKQLPTLILVSIDEVACHGKIAKYKLSEVGKKAAFLVEFDCFDSTVTCSCKKYESDGILCVHALKVLNERNILEIPPQYILKRWTKSAKDCVETVGHVGTADGPNRRFDVNRLSAGETEEGSLLSSPNGTMLRKELLALLEESFKEHNTLTYMQELALAKKLNLRPGIVKMWFQNRRAREKWNQAEMDREYLKRCCEMLAEGNRRLQKELQEKIKDLETVTRFQLVNSTTTEPMCPSRERLATAASSSVAAATTTTCANPIAITPSPSTL